MEVSFESFSIRQYTARMRRVDASKCWPFDGDGGGSQLPPIECRRYRWWSSELQIARSAGACEQRAGDTEHACGGVVSRANATVVPGAEDARGGEPPTTDGEPVVRPAVLVLPAQASPVKEDEDGEEDGRQPRSPGKAKVRAPKKRSIVELFAVAPQIEAVEDEAEGDDDGEVLAVGKASKEEPKHDDQLGKDAVEEPRKRREESVETLMRKKIEKNCAIKTKNEDKMKMKKKKNKRTKLMMKKKQKLLKRQKKQKNSMKIGIAKKEKFCNLSLQSPVDFARLLHDSVIMKRLGKEIEVPVYAQKRKASKPKNASIQNKVKAVQASKLKKQLCEPKKFPIHGILKNQKTVSSPGIGMVHVTDGSQNGEGHRAQQSEKHVRFSGKDGILGHGERHCSPLGSPQMQSLCKVFSDVLTASSVVDKSHEGDKLSECSNKAQVATANKDIGSDCVDKGKTGEPLQLQQLTDIHDVTNAATSANPQSSYPEKKLALDDCVDLNNSVQIHNDLNEIYLCPTEPLLKVMTSSQPEGSNPQVVDNPGKKTSGIDDDIGLHSGPAEVITPANVVRNSNSEMATCSLSEDMVASKSQFYPVVDNNKEVYAYESQFQSSRLLERDMMSTVYSTGSMRQLYHMDNFPESRLKANPADVFHDKHTSGNIVGLPLNSQGEYIHMQSSPQFGFDQLFKRQNMMLGPVSSFLAHNSIIPSSNDHINMKGKVPLTSAYVENQQKWAPEKCFSRDQSIVMPVCGFTELEDISLRGLRNKESVRKYDQSVSSLNVEGNIFRLPCHGFREHNQSDSCNDRAMAEPEGASEPGFLSVTQPTMRLMGKNFIVGRHDNNKEHQGSGDSKIQADKRMVFDIHPTFRMADETIPKHWPGPEWATHPASGTSYENLMHTVETLEKPGVSNFYHLAVDPRSDNAHLDYGLGIVSGNSCHSVSFSHGCKLDTFNHSHAPEPWLNKASMSKKNRRSEPESLKMGFHAPLAVCNPETVCQHLLLNSTHCKHSQSLSRSLTSTFSPSSPFQGPDNGKYAQIPLAQCSSQSLPHWLVNAGQKRNTSNSSALSFQENPVRKHEPRAKLGTSFSLHSPPLTAIVPFPSLGQNSRVCFSDVSTPSLAHPSLYPPFPAAKPSSMSGACYWTMCNTRDDMNSNCPFLRSSDFASRTRKRPPPCSTDFLKPMKRPNLCMQGDSGSSLGSKKGDELHVCTEHVSKMLELHSGDKAVKVNDVVKDVHAPSTSKLDTGSRSRPVKLSAGAKHILKPSLNVDQDNSMPTHSTIPFARGTSSGKVPVSRKKPAKVYQF